MRVSYPLKDISTDAEAKNYFGHRNLFGKYPISAHNTWHGGVHLEGIAKEIQCVANGRIIAYRFAKDYKKTVINNTDHLYSNAFILIQHDYKSKEKQKMTFYSLYHHLMPETDINKQKKDIPSFLSKSSYVVKSKEGIPIEGLNARVLKNNQIDKTKNGVSVVIPKGSTVNLDPLTDSKIKTGSYKRVTYTDKNGKIYTDIYIYAVVGTQVKKITDNTLQIITNEDKTEDKSVLGGRVRAAGKSSAKIVKIIPYNESVEIDKSVKGNWKKLKDGTGYIHNSVLTTKKVFDDSKGKIDEIVACDIPIKAGKIIGYTGDFGFEGYQGYKATHLEIFTTDDVCEFLNNEKKDGKEAQYFTDIKVGTKLKTSLSYKVDIKKNTPVKVLNFEGDYAQVKVTAITATLVRDTDINDSDVKHYTIKNFATVSKAFNGLVTKDTFFSKVKRYDPSKKYNEDLRRIVTFYPEGYNKIFWIEKKALAQVKEKVKKEQNLYDLIIPEYLQTEEQKYKTITRDAKVGDKTTLSAKVSKAYIELPMSKEEEITIYEGEESIVDLRKCKKATDNNKDIWYKIVLDKFKIPRRIVRGWIKEKDLDKFSAYNWKKFGFKSLDAGNEYVYSVKDLREATDSSTFVTEVWDAVDKDGNKILDVVELVRAFNKPEIVHKLSHLVCKHKNEWSYKMSEIKSEIKELYDFGIQLEEDSAKKQKLESKRDDRLSKLETKIKDLMWWDEAKAKPYTAPVKKEEKTKTSSTKRPSILPEGEKVEQKTTPTPIKDTPQKDVVPLGNKTTAAKPDTKSKNGVTPKTTTPTTATPKAKAEEKEVPPERMFPSTNIVHHFHPIAWVEQMRRIFGGGVACEALIWGEKFTCKERKKVIQIAENLGVGSDKIEGANWIMAVMSLETGGTFDPSITNSLGYTGLIQFGGSAAKSLGTTTKKLREMTVLEQLEYVEKYFNKYKSKLKTITDLYLSVLYPKASGHGLEKDYVVFDDTKKAYKANPAFFYEDDEVDKNSKGKIIKRHGKTGGKTYVWEVKKAIQSWYDRGLSKKNRCKIDTSTCSFASGENQTNDGKAPWMKIAKGELGVKEIFGSKHNKRILEYHKVSGGFSTDEVPWCASFVNWVMKQAGYTTVSAPARAKSWENFGKKITTPIYGSIGVKSRKGGGHVAFIVGKSEDGKYYYMLGGNQHDEVNITKYKKSVWNTFVVPKDYDIKAKSLPIYTKKSKKSGKES